MEANPKENNTSFISMTFLLIITLVLCLSGLKCTDMYFEKEIKISYLDCVKAKSQVECK